jgi:N-acetylneuraminic acid mutarotase
VILNLGQQSILAIGGYCGGAFDTAELYDCATDEWTPLPNMLSKRCCYHAIGRSTDGNIYVAGGYNGSNGLNSAEMLDLTTKTWNLLPPMNDKRYRTSGTFLGCGTKFLVTGGYNVENRLSFCEIFDIAASTWTEVAPLFGPRDSHCAVLYQDKAVVLGGYNDCYLNTCEQYDALNNTWSLFPAFNIARGWFGAAVVQNNIYVAGGYNDNVLDSIEVFDGAVWTVLVAKLTKPRDYCAAVCFQNKLAVLGGNHGFVDVYDSDTEEVKPDIIPQMKTNPVRCMLASISF